MRIEEFAKMRALECTHWWFRGRRRLLHHLVQHVGLRDALVLDAGCGTGFAGYELSRAGTVIGMDASTEALALSSGEQRIFCASGIERSPFREGSFDLIVALDLLEHLEDDLQALKEIWRVCKPGGYLFVTVPAYQQIWSRHDEALGHQRRYSLAELAGKIRDAGFTVCRLSYFVTAAFPLAAAYRLIRRMSSSSEAHTDLFLTPGPLNTILSIVMALESWLVWRWKLPFGLTALALARKEDGEDSNRGVRG